MVQSEHPRTAYRPGDPRFAWIEEGMEVIPHPPARRAWLLPFALGWLSATLGAIAAFALVHFS
ncbi:MAG: hypothetical protein RL490_118 [Pseudomonadota bacterium]